MAVTFWYQRFIVHVAYRILSQVDVFISSSVDIPTVSAMELVNYTKAGFLEKKRPGIGIGIGMFTV
jgi:hypothetical protein